MTKITGSFITLVGIIIFSSILYIWQSEAKIKVLETQVTAQQIEIDTLQSKLENLTKNQDSLGEVEGVTTTSTGTISGQIILNTTEQNESVIVCAQETRTKQEYCTDFFLEQNKLVYEYNFEIPQGRYEVYAILPPLDNKIYYSEISNCDSDTNCITNTEKKRLIQVSENETQNDINISL